MVLADSTIQDATTAKPGYAIRFGFWPKPRKKRA